MPGYPVMKTEPQAGTFIIPGASPGKSKESQADTFIIPEMLPERILKGDVLRKH